MAKNKEAIASTLADSAIRGNRKYESVSVSMRSTFKAEISRHCEKNDLEFSRWIVAAIDEKMARDLEK